MSLQLVTAPAALPLDWEAEVKSHLRLDTDDERARVESVTVSAVKEWAEGFTNRALVTQTWRLFMDQFPGVLEPIEIPKPPLRSIAHIKYYDTAGVQQTWDAAQYDVDPPIASPNPVFDPHCQPYRVWPAYGQTYPSTQVQRQAVEIEFICGYGSTSSAVPGKLRQAMLLLVGEMFERREETVTGTSVQEIKQTAERLAWPFRVNLFARVA